MMPFHPINWNVPRTWAQRVRGEMCNGNGFSRSDPLTEDRTHTISEARSRGYWNQQPTTTIPKQILSSSHTNTSHQTIFIYCMWFPHTHTWH
jgi:hypothetical protein